MTDRMCPDCGSDCIHRSRRRNRLDRVLRIVGGRTCRCHACNARFAQFGQALVRINAVRRAGRGLAFAFMMITAAAAVLAGIVWFSHSTPSYGSEETQGVLWAPPAQPAPGVRGA
jgi:hypothetical protein